MSSLKKLENYSFTSNLEYISNNVETLKEISNNINSNYESKNFYLIEKINKDLNNIKRIMREKNFNIKMENSATLKLMSLVHFYEKDGLKLPDIRILDYSHYTIHPVPIVWKMWDKYFNQIEIAYPEIKWDSYSKPDILMCIFLWISWRGTNYYNNEIKKEGDKELTNLRPGCFGKFEFFIILDGYIKNSVAINFELISNIIENTYCNINFSMFKKAINYVYDNKITLLRFKYQNYVDSDCYGLKTYSYDDFININNLNKKSGENLKDWIDYGIHDGFKNDYKFLIKKRKFNNK